jgi:hypothetical protein
VIFTEVLAVFVYKTHILTAEAYDAWNSVSVPLLIYSGTYSDSNSILVPDDQYLMSNGHAPLKEVAQRTNSPWHSKASKAVFRGVTTGGPKKGIQLGHELEVPRVKLAYLSRSMEELVSGSTPLSISSDSSYITK